VADDLRPLQQVVQRRPLAADRGSAPVLAMRPPTLQLSESVAVGLESVWKLGLGRAMTYAPEHEKDLLNRSVRRRMGVS
jgi:hypothetical protein